MTLQYADDVEELEEVPAFNLAVYDDGIGEIEITVSTPQNPSILNHAGLGLLYGLAILIADSNGTIHQIVDDLLTAGPLSEVDVANQVAALLAGDANALPA